MDSGQWTVDTRQEDEGRRLVLSYYRFIVLWYDPEQEVQAIKGDVMDSWEYYLEETDCNRLAREDWFKDTCNYSPPRTYQKPSLAFRRFIHARRSTPSTRSTTCAFLHYGVTALMHSCARMSTFLPWPASLPASTYHNRPSLNALGPPFMFPPSIFHIFII